MQRTNLTHILYRTESAFGCFVLAMILIICLHFIPANGQRLSIVYHCVSILALILIALTIFSAANAGFSFLSYKPIKIIFSTMMSYLTFITANHFGIIYIHSRWVWYELLFATIAFFTILALFYILFSEKHIKLCAECITFVLLLYHLPLLYPPH